MLLLNPISDCKEFLWRPPLYAIRDDRQSSLLDRMKKHCVHVCGTQYILPGSLHKHGKQPRRWLVTERGGNKTERVHIHGIIFTDLDNDTILKSWKFGIADDGRSTGRKGWVNEQTINYITKYVFKTDSKHIDF